MMTILPPLSAFCMSIDLSLAKLVSVRASIAEMFGLGLTFLRMVLIFLCKKDPSPMMLLFKFLSGGLQSGLPENLRMGRLGDPRKKCLICRLRMKRASCFL